MDVNINKTPWTLLSLFYTLQPSALCHSWANDAFLAKAVIVIIIGGMAFASDYELINGKSIKAVVSMQIQNQKQTECSWFISENHYHSV